MAGSKRFTIKFERGAYYVDIPNYGGGEVVEASAVDALVKALQDICQRANEGRPGEMALIDTIHAMHAIARAALTAA